MTSLARYEFVRVAGPHGGLAVARRMSPPTPVGYCQCGCGEKTAIETKTRTHRGLLKGQPRRYLMGHWARVRREVPLPDAPIAGPDGIATYQLGPRTIPLANGKGETLVDADVFEWASRLRWARSGAKASRSYPVTTLRDADGISRPVLLHRLILSAPPGLQVDHINRSRLDNRRVNLRLVTPGENNQNSVATWGRSGVRGVRWNPSGQRWSAAITVDGRHHFLGNYSTVEEAARAVAVARPRLHPYAPDTTETRS